jgi:hypothetical protein
LFAIPIRGVGYDTASVSIAATLYLQYTNHVCTVFMTYKLGLSFVGVLYPGYRRPLVTAQKSRYNRFPTAANNWGTKYPIPDMAPPLLDEEEGPPT